MLLALAAPRTLPSAMPPSRAIRSASVSVKGSIISATWSNSRCSCMKSRPLTFQWATFVWLYRSKLSAIVALSRSTSEVLVLGWMSIAVFALDAGLLAALLRLGAALLPDLLLLVLVCAIFINFLSSWTAGFMIGPHLPDVRKPTRNALTPH